MILSHRHYPFHSAISVLQFGPGCIIRISTTKEGIFKGLSTMLSLLPHSLAGVGEGAVFGKIMWADALRATDQQKAHDGLVEWLDAWLSLMKDEVTTRQICLGLDAAELKYCQSGMAKEVVNLLRSLQT